jgi:hypothetical protein
MSWGEALHTLQVILITWLLVGIGTGCIYVAWRYKRRKR